MERIKMKYDTHSPKKKLLKSQQSSTLQILGTFYFY